MFREYIRNQKGGSCSAPITNLNDDQRRELMGRGTEISLHEVGV
jgi:hypothetical protein